MSITRIICDSCDLPQAWCKCTNREVKEEEYYLIQTKSFPNEQFQNVGYIDQDGRRHEKRKNLRMELKVFNAHVNKGKDQQWRLIKRRVVIEDVIIKEYAGEVKE